MSTNENKIYTIKDFYLAFRDLKNKQNLSLGQISIRTGLSKSFLSDIMNNKVLPPKDEFIEKIARAFGVDPDYFFEYRLRRLNDFISKNRDFLGYCIKGSLNYKNNNKV
ncbi:MAG: helix-turn-helix transcriptional regulator [Actinomycetota bacterium]|nr:helix-turn-helix transcriptional regulator [Actinomycetota bacterium]